MMYINDAISTSPQEAFLTFRQNSAVQHLALYPDDTIRTELPHSRDIKTI